MDKHQYAPRQFVGIQQESRTGQENNNSVDFQRRGKKKESGAMQQAPVTVS